MALLLFGTFFIMLILGVPIAFSLGTASLITFIVNSDSLTLLPMQVFAAIGKFTLLAIPFFILAGNIMEKAGISDKLIVLADKAVGHKRSGLAIVTIITSVFFAAISGSGPATVAALGGILIPAMIKNGYEEGASAALMATSGSIGIIIPPSIAFVVFGAISGVSIGKLFIAGIIPGLMIGAGLIAISIFLSKKMDITVREKAKPGEVKKAFFEAFWGLMMPVIILGGIYGGIFTPTEAAAFSAVYGLIVGVFVYRSLKLKDLYEIFLSTVIQSAVIMFVVATATVFAWIVTTQGVARDAANLIFSISGGNLIIFLLMVNVVLLIAGCFVDAISAFYLFIPILLPVAVQMGYDPLALGVVMTVNLALGQVTPPVGVNLYVAAPLADISLNKISKAVLPYLFVSILVLLLMTYMPVFITFLPNLLGVK